MSKPVITLNTTWACPDCGNHNNDKQQSNEGVIDDLQCYDCDSVFSIYSKLQSDCLAYMSTFDECYVSDTAREDALSHAVQDFNLKHSSHLDPEEMYQLYLEY